MVRSRGQLLLTGAFALCGASLAPLIVAPEVTVRGGFDFDRVENAAHVLAAALVVVTLVLVQRRPTRPLALAIAVTLTLAAALLAEVVQSQMPGRSASAADLLYDLGGVAAGLVALALGRQRIDTRQLRWAVSVVLLVLGIGTWALVH